MDGFLYCIGGNDGTMCLQTGEKFNPRRNVWEPIASMHSRRYLRTVGKFHDFSIIQNLREINFGDIRSAKSDTLTHVEAVKFEFL